MLLPQRCDCCWGVKLGTREEDAPRLEAKTVPREHLLAPFDARQQHRQRLEALGQSVTLLESCTNAVRMPGLQLEPLGAAKAFG